MEKRINKYWAGGVDTKGGCKGGLPSGRLPVHGEPLDNMKEYRDLVKEMEVRFYFIWSTVL